MKLEQAIYVGLDTHKETIHGTVLDKEGKEICSYSFPNGKDALREFLKEFPVWNTNIALEACGIWRGCYKILQELGYQTKLANPLKCHQIASDKKTDRVDSKILADLLRTGYLPEVYIPNDEILALRDLTRHKCNLTRFKVRLMNKIKGYLLREGIKYEKKIWNEKGIDWIKSLENYQLNDFVKLYELTRREEKLTAKKISNIARMKPETELLMTIPGIGDFGASLIYAEIGNIKRFPTVKHLHAYAGVAPGIYQSGSKTRMTTRKQIDYWLKWIIMECAGRVTITKSPLQEYYFRLRKRKGWKTARKATARKMLSIVWHILNDKIPYHAPEWEGKGNPRKKPMIS